MLTNVPGPMEPLLKRMDIPTILLLVTESISFNKIGIQ